MRPRAGLGLEQGQYGIPVGMRRFAGQTLSGIVQSLSQLVHLRQLGEEAILLKQDRIQTVQPNQQDGRGVQRPLVHDSEVEDVPLARRTVQRNVADLIFNHPLLADSIKHQHGARHHRGSGRKPYRIQTDHKHITMRPGRLLVYGCQERSPARWSALGSQAQDRLCCGAWRCRKLQGWRPQRNTDLTWSGSCGRDWNRSPCKRSFAVTCWKHLDDNGLGR
mmetsp:Transcript_60615/g.162609  ORF Transcript_60615/g.162609 Transcript_60615/m.162609 type:complete len:220 (+) Transcript_60615:1404-2063(+)